MAEIRALAALRRLRGIETSVARRELARALAREQAQAEQDTAIARQLEDARREADLFDRESFSRWIDGRLTERARLADALREAEARTVAARGALARQRLAETAARNSLDDRLAERATEAARRAQQELEELARRGG